MKVKVERCFDGHKLYHRLTMPNGAREFMMHEDWTRQTSIEAKDLIENNYLVKRQNIRFV